MNVPAGGGGVATILPVLDPRVQSRYFLDTPHTFTFRVHFETTLSVFECSKTVVSSYNATKNIRHEIELQPINT